MMVCQLNPLSDVSVKKKKSLLTSNIIRINIQRAIQSRFFAHQAVLIRLRRHERRITVPIGVEHRK